MGKQNLDKQNLGVTHRFMEKEKLLKQFDKLIVTLECYETEITDHKNASEKISVEYAIKGCCGPTVVLINGAGGPIEGWMKVWPLFDESMTVFAYNRPGIDKSSEPTDPQNAKNMVDELRKVLLAVGLQPPYLLVGHSLGGFIAHVFASMYQQEVTGILFLEASTVEDVDDSNLKPKKMKGNPLNEINCVGETVAHIKSLASFPQIPITVIAGFHPVSRMWLPKGRFFKRFEHQKKLLELSVQSSLIVASKSGHFPQISEPRLVVEAIYNMIGRFNSNQYIVKSYVSKR